MIFRSPTVIIYDVNGAPVEVATEATLATLASEAKLESVRVLLATLASKDFATEVKLEEVRALLQSLSAEDFATEATLAGVKTGTDRIPVSPAQEHVVAASPHATRLTDGIAFYKATTPSDTQPVSGPLTDAQLRASAVDVDDGHPDPQIDALTDAQLRATAVSISAATLPLPTGAATAANQQTDALTNTQLRASAVPVSATSLPLPDGAATQATLATLLTELQAKADLAETQPVSGPLTDIQLRASAVPISASSLPLPAGAATQATLSTVSGTLLDIRTGTDKIPTSPSQEHVTAASPHATRLTDGSAFYKATTPSDTQPVSAASLPLPTGASTETTLLHNARGDVRYLKRFDIQATVIYTGYAPNGTAAGATGWTIKRTQLTLGNPTVEEWTTEGGAVWDDRATETYS